jgi:hypothetical protein
LNPACAADNDTASQYGGCRPNAIGSNFGLGAGKLVNDPNLGPYVPYFTPSPYQLGGSCPTATDPNALCPDTFGPYARPAAGTFGNIHRDSLYGPGLVNTDLSVAKKFALTERASIAFRADAFNLFNKANLGQPNSCVDCGGTSGLITSTISSADGTSMRRLQFSLRLEF